MYTDLSATYRTGMRFYIAYIFPKNGDIYIAIYNGDITNIQKIQH